jgi:hypothetical protein
MMDIGAANAPSVPLCIAAIGAIGAVGALDAIAVRSKNSDLDWLSINSLVTFPIVGVTTTVIMQLHIVCLSIHWYQLQRIFSFIAGFYTNVRPCDADRVTKQLALKGQAHWSPRQRLFCRCPTGVTCPSR